MTAEHQYTATVVWQRGDGEKFTDNRYRRVHQWRFDGGITVPASSAPSSVPLPLSSAEAVDPEEAFVAALSSCHMLFFLFHAAKKGHVVDRYEDEAVAVMGKTASGRRGIVKVTLRPAVRWGGPAPTAEELHALHEQSHHDCYIANSVTAEVVVESR
ncbi:MAG: OsmC family peroxiredoxin [Nevskiaceae bacterium]|nr:MAG: OsmC family peroxiredoxin [Nevskiaceae bacterium]